MKITERVIVANIDSMFVDSRFCDHCTDDTLASLTGEITRAVIGNVALSGGRTVLSVKSTPQRALFSVDGNPVGATDASIAVLPGSHVVTIEHDGFETATRTVEAVEGKTAEVSVTLRRLAGHEHDPAQPSDGHVDDHHGPVGSHGDRDDKHPLTDHPYLVPGVVIGFGVLALAGGTYVSWTSTDDKTGPQRENL